MANDITKTGTEGLSGVRNSDLYPDDPPKLTDKDREFLKQSQNDLAFSQYFANQMKGYGSRTVNPAIQTLQRDTSIPSYGYSRFDRGVGSDVSQSSIINARAANQPEILKLLNGTVKGVLTAGEVFVDSIVGIPVGLINSFVNLADQDETTSFVDGFWNNPISRARQNVADWQEKALPNYYREGTENTVFGGGFANFLGDKLIKTLGFTTGAILAGTLTGISLGNASANLAGKIALNVFKASAKNTRVASAWTKSFIGSAVGATGEATIEALNNSRDWYNVQKQKLDLQLQNGIITQDQYNDLLQRANQDRIKMGNADFLANVVLLTAGNMIQFGKTFAGGYKTSLKLWNILKDPKSLVYQVEKIGKGRIARNAVVDALTEAHEEMSQGVVSAAAGFGMENDLMNYFKAGKDYKAQNSVTAMLNNLGKSMAAVYGDPQMWNEGLMGFIIGLTGAPGVGMRKSGNIGVTWNGGIKEAITDYNESKKNTEELASWLTARRSDPKFQAYYEHLVRHAYYQDVKQQAAAMDNKRVFKDAEYAQMIADIEKFSKAGLLDDLKEFVNELNPDDATIEDMIKASNISPDESNRNVNVGPFTDENGNLKSKEEIAEQINKYKQTLTKTIDEYSNIREDLFAHFGGSASDEVINELTWMKMQSKNWAERSEQLFKEMEPIVEKIGLSIKDIQNKTIKPIDFVDIVRNNPSLTQEEKDEVIEKFTDAFDCTSASINYAAKSTFYEKNPTRLIDDMNLTYKQIESEYYDNEANDYINQLQAVEDYDNAHTIINSIDDTILRKRVIDSLKKSGNDKIKSFIEDIENHIKLSDAVIDAIESDAIRSKISDETLDSLITIIDNAAKNTTTAQELSNAIDESIRNSEEESNIIKAEAQSRGEEAYTLNDALKDIQKIIKDAETLNESNKTVTPENPDKGNKKKPKSEKPKSQKQQPQEQKSKDKIPSNQQENAEQVVSEMEEKRPGLGNFLAELQKKATIIPENSETTPKTQIGTTPQDKKVIQTPNGFTQVNNEERAKLEGIQQENINNTEPILSNDKETQYDYSEAYNGPQNGIYKEARLLTETKYRGTKENNPNGYEKVQALEKLGVYAFVDSGKLAEMLENNPDLPIHYIQISDIYDSSSPYSALQRIHEGYKSAEILLAVEAKTETSIQAMDKDGVTKSYQIIGMLKSNKNDEATGIYNYLAVRFGTKREALNKKFKSLNEKPQFYVYDKTDRINTINTGRIVADAKKRTLKSLPDFNSNEKIILGITVNNSLQTNASNEELEKFVEINPYHKESGTLVLYTKEADGRYYPKVLSTDTLNKENNDTKIAREIKRLIGNIVTKETDTERKAAKDLLEKYLRLTSATTETIVDIVGFNSDYANIRIGDTFYKISGINDENLNGSQTYTKAEYDTTDEIVEAAFEALCAKEPRYNISAELLTGQNSKSYVDLLVDSDVITTDLVRMHNVAANFTLTYQRTDNNKTTGTNPTRKNKDVNTTRETVRKRSYKNNNYHKQNDKWYDVNNVEVTEELSEILDFRNDIDTGKITPTKWTDKNKEHEFYQLNNKIGYHRIKENGKSVKSEYVENEQRINNILNKIKQSKREDSASSLAELVSGVQNGNIEFTATSQKSDSNNESEIKGPRQTAAPTFTHSKEGSTTTTHRGERQLKKGFDNIKNATNPIEKGNAIGFIESNVYAGAEITAEEKATLEQAKQELADQGYEVVDILGKPYNEGMRVTANFIADETAPVGSQTITGIYKPQINKDGVMIQAAEILVTIGPEKAVTKQTAVSQSITSQSFTGSNEITDNTVPVNQEAIEKINSDQSESVKELEAYADIVNLANLGDGETFTDEGQQFDSDTFTDFGFNETDVPTGDDIANGTVSFNNGNQTVESPAETNSDKKEKESKEPLSTPSDNNDNTPKCFAATQAGQRRRRRSDVDDKKAKDNCL